MSNHYIVNVQHTWNYVVGLDNDVVDMREAVISAAEKAIIADIKNDQFLGKNVGELGSDTLFEVEPTDLDADDVLINEDVSCQ